LVVTSFNWLSFRGDGRGGYRQEVGTLITDYTYVDEQYGIFKAQIADDH
jgi:autotransporter translocation and assembly factor TamB